MKRVCQNDFWGAVDDNGNIVIPFLFEAFEDFWQGVAWVKKDGKWGLIDKTGGVVVPCDYEELRKAAGKKYYWVRKNGKWGMVLRATYGNKEIIPCDYEETGTFWYNRAVVKKNGCWGAVNTDGRQVVPCTYDEVHDWHGRGYRVRKEDKWGIVGNDFSLPCEFNFIGNLCFNRFRLKKDGKWGYGNEKGIILVQPQYEYGTDFQLPWKYNNYVYARVKRNGHWGIIDVAGHGVVPCRYERVGFMYYNDYLPGGFYAWRNGCHYEGWGRDFLTK